MGWVEITQTEALLHRWIAACNFSARQPHIHLLYQNLLCSNLMNSSATVSTLSLQISLLPSLTQIGGS